MTILNAELLPAARLAVVYARSDVRPAFSLLLAFDQRLGAIVGRTSEPMIAQMKIAWWNDALKREPSARPKGEPVFELLRDLDMTEVEAAMQVLLDAWDGLLAVDEWTPDILETFAKARSAAIFGSYARWVSSGHEVTDMGKAWALGDLQQHFGSRMLRPVAPTAAFERTARALRPLSILTLSVQKPSGLRMILHALTGR